MSGAREDILASVRDALQRPTDPHVRTRTEVGAAFREDPMVARRLMPVVPPDLAGRIARFAERSAVLTTRLLRVPDASAAMDELVRLAAAEGWSRIARHEADLLDQVVGGRFTVPQYVIGREPFDKRALAACDAGITTCECLIAQTGSVLVTPAQGGRALSVLPEHHVVVATVDDLMPDLPAAWARVASRSQGLGFASLITGPSRTGDIERVLVLGAHGPKRLTVLMIGGDDA